MKTSEQNQRGTAAFSMIELLAVVVMLALLAAMLLPVLANGRQRSNLATCMNNQRQLAQAWRMHADDNADALVGMSDVFRTDWRVRPGNPDFIPLPPPAPNSDRAGVILWDSWGYQLGAIYPYAPDPQLLHCPDDPRLEKAFAPAYTSYSGAHGLTDASYAMRKASDIRHPGERYLWVEENDPRYIAYQGRTIGENLGSWSLVGAGNSWPAPPDYSQVTRWYDGPAAFHVTGATFSYADGHVGFYRWRDEGTFRFINDPQGGRAGAYEYSSPNDLLFVAKGFASRLNP